MHERGKVGIFLCIFYLKVGSFFKIVARAKKNVDNFLNRPKRKSETVFASACERFVNVLKKVQKGLENAEVLWYNIKVGKSARRVSKKAFPRL